MAGKRAAPDDHGDNKRPRADEPDPAAGQKNSIAAQIAAFRARTAALVGSAKPASPAAPTPASPTPVETAKAQADAKIAAMRARLDASNKAKTTGNDTSSQQRPSSSKNEQPAIGGRGGLNAALHPSLMSKTNQSKDQSAPVGGRGGLNAALHPSLMPKNQKQSKDQAAAGKTGTSGNRFKHGAKKMELDMTEPSLDELKQNPYFDSSLRGGSKPRVSRAIVFNEQGRYVAQGDTMRRQAQLEEMKQRIAESARRAELELDKSEEGFLTNKNVPQIEWWDEALVNGDEYPDFSHPDAEAQLKITSEDSIITRFVQHPVALPAPRESKPFVPKAMHLTPKEQKKQRRQRRMTDLKEKQAKVRLGLEPPEPPKVKKSNLMRVLGDEAIRDPTAVEARVDREIAERAERHEEDNAERKLSKEARLEKLKLNAAADAAKGIQISVYRIDSLAYGKNRAKILMNVKQCYDLTGILLTHPQCCVLIVESGAHTGNFLRKLLLRRIDWTENAPTPAVDPDDERERERDPVPKWLLAEDEDGDLKDLSGNGCHLLWEGEEKERRFKKWSQNDCATEGEARQTLERNKMENMWMLAKAYSPDE